MKFGGLIHRRQALVPGPRFGSACAIAWLRDWRFAEEGPKARGVSWIQSRVRVVGLDVGLDCP
jgi:hypothetical protein